MKPSMMTTLYCTAISVMLVVSVNNTAALAGELAGDYMTIQFADINGDRKADVCGRGFW